MNVLAFFAHPDDETMLIGGTLALLSRAGASVHYLCATRGEGGELGEPAVCAREEIGMVREQEMRCAVEQLGGTSLTFLDYVDPLVGPADELYAFASDLEEVADRLFMVLSMQKVDALITHGSNGEYGHPAHRLIYEAAAKVVRRFGDDAPLWYTVHANFPEHPRPTSVNKEDPAHLVIDIEAVRAAKTAAAFCHRSQHALFVRRRSEQEGRRMEVHEVILPLESMHRAWPPAPSVVDDELAALLLNTGSVRVHHPTGSGDGS